MIHRIGCLTIILLRPKVSKGRPESPLAGFGAEPRERKNMLDKLDWVHPRMEELGALLSDPEIVQDQEKWRALMREHSQLEPLDQAVSRYAHMIESRAEAQEMLSDPDMGAMAKEELAQLEAAIPEVEREIQLLLLPKDPNAGRSVVMEIRGGAGGEEAALFGSLLMRMYTCFERSRNHCLVL